MDCGDSGRYAAKLYFRHGPDERDRLGAEFSALGFLWANGVRCVPRPVAADRDRGWAVYEFIDGAKIGSDQVEDGDIDSAVDFLAELKALKDAAGSRSLSRASEACFSVRAIVDNIQLRLGRLTALGRHDPQHDTLQAFLSTEFVPSFDEITGSCRAEMDRSALDFERELSYEERTLSPSDFGFHNALRRSDGQIVFLDFEHFGWDDPAKMVSDFLLHPGMELNEGLKQRFVSGILGRIVGSERLASRVGIVYPLFGLKWCMILLNEFLPEHLSRREFASATEFNTEELRSKQLEKARTMLEKARSGYERFPYHA